ncbi:hypothetical protein HY030_01765 [Candidatus Gottesmanbacteria bacterium]|nr:hypothetical protein [Candidatus Gottesmanbacteria bacterium]
MSNSLREAVEFRSSIPRAYFADAPNMYERNVDLIESLNAGHTITDDDAMDWYFQRQRSVDPAYMREIDRIRAARQRLCPEAAALIPLRRLNLIIPTYREEAVLPSFLATMQRQFVGSKETDWGITFVFNYALPPKKENEFDSCRRMLDTIRTFLQENPRLRPRIDWITYATGPKLADKILPVSFARTVGEDTVMSERIATDIKNPQPFYLGLNDADVYSLSPGLINAMVAALPNMYNEPSRIIRVRGSYDRVDVRKNPHLHPLEMVWEGVTSAIGLTTTHNPFNIGRLSAVPARELAMTGGGFVNRLEFTDEDIRRGIQVAWQLPNTQTVEIPGYYVTSARRELETMDVAKFMMEQKGRRFDYEAMRHAALIEMYANFAARNYRSAESSDGVQLSTKNIFASDEAFSKAVPSSVIGAVVNAFHRFTLFGIFAIEKLQNSPHAEEVSKLRADFLKGAIPYFRVQLDTHEFLLNLPRNDARRYSKLRPLLGEVDEQSRTVVRQILEKYGIVFTEDREPIYGLQELPPLDPNLSDEENKRRRSGVVLKAPFYIAPTQPKYREILDQLVS